MINSVTLPFLLLSLGLIGPCPIAAASFLNLVAFAPNFMHNSSVSVSSNTGTAAGTAAGIASKNGSMLHSDMTDMSDNSKREDHDDSTSKLKQSILFEEFASFLQSKQIEITKQIEDIDGSGETFSRDTWGIFHNTATTATGNQQESESSPHPISTSGSGGITRVIQGGNVVEKGACSLTVLRGGKLSAERAAAIRGRQDDQSQAQQIKEGDEYSAAALSMVLHTRSPFVPTFRSDVRIFMVQPSSSGDSTCSESLAWFGGEVLFILLYIIIIIIICNSF